MEALIQIRRGTAAQWTSANPALADGEPGLETDTGKGKYGAGGAKWNTLPYSWQLLNTGPTGPAGGGLTGTYPNPTLAANSVGAAQITDGTVGTAELANGAVSTTKIASLAVGAGQLADNAVIGAKIADGAVDTLKIADGSIGLGDLNQGTVDSLMVDVLDESALVQKNANQINFTGIGVTATAAAGVVTIDVPGGTPGTTIPPGTISDWTNATPPSGWYLCDGTVHADLAGTLGSRYGTAAGTVPKIGPIPNDQSVNTISTIASAISGYAIDAASVEVHNGIVALRIQVHRSGGDVTLGGPSHADQAICTLKAPWLPILSCGGSCYNAIRTFNLSASTGQMALTAGLRSMSDASINKDDVFVMYLAYGADMSRWTLPAIWKIIKAP